MIGARRGAGWTLVAAWVSAATAAACTSREPPAAAVQVLSGEPAAWDSGGRLIVRFVPWVEGSDALRPGPDSLVPTAIGALASRLRVGSRYRIHVVVEPNADARVAQELAFRRGARVAWWLMRAGTPSAALHLAQIDGEAGADCRIELLPDDR